jgi:hypothetical protein
MCIILAPPGSGKSFWTTSHPDWTDGDELYADMHALAWHRIKHTASEEQAHYEAIDKRMDIDRGTHNIITSLYWDIAPDAVVIINEDVHRARVQHRSDLRWKDVQAVTSAMRETAFKYNVPIFTSFDEASRHSLAQNPLQGCCPCAIC